MKVYKIVDKKKYLLLIQIEKGYQIFFLLNDLYREESSFYRRNFFPITNTDKFKKVYYVDTSKRYRVKVNALNLKFFTELSENDQKKLKFFLENKENHLS
ncbi:hypothetical protein [Xylocopilactobacillus apis]|uniref:Uncharacterized protein n=1 Tax=Xylocopilactobacillus apis TaxID=2932183 RepID=A0AAU9DN54_9LACO|nr:hypothetical protein [Xylocopilactobacillus apis]BDR56363.1 hypothetical protein KIMC2_09250 [Xylocopilactobacillus apis]